MIKISTLLRALIEASEKAASIARVLRENEIVFKSSLEVKPTETGYVDYKTLADVLAQSVIQHDLLVQFPDLGTIIGEEDSNLTNSNCEKINVELCSTALQTHCLLDSFLKNVEIAQALADVIHGEPKRLQLPVNIDICEEELTQSSLGLLIDPIDGTNEYVRGGDIKHPEGFSLHGLPCVTVLIGVYDRRTGVPLVGVINKPFLTRRGKSWSGGVIWGVMYGTLCLSSVTLEPAQGRRDRLVIAVSADENLGCILTNDRYQIISPRGAGNKMQLVMEGVADLYLITGAANSGFVYNWDICAGHVLLRSVGGGVVNFLRAYHSLQNFSGDVRDFPFTDYEITYRTSMTSEEPCQSVDPRISQYVDGGLVAYRSISYLHRLFRDLRYLSIQQK